MGINNVTLYATVTSSLVGAVPGFRSGQTVRTQHLVLASDLLGPGLTGDIVLPPLGTPDTNLITQNASMEGNMFLPIQLDVFMALGSKSTVALFPPGLDAHIDNPVVLRGAIKLPVPTVAGVVNNPTHLNGSVTLPVLAVAMRVGWSFSPKGLPPLGVSGRIWTELKLGSGAEVGGSIELPALRASGSWHQTEGVLRGDIFLPPLLGAGASINVEAGGLVLPPLRTAGQISNGQGASYQTWAMNLSNKGVSLFTNFPFRQMCRAFDRYSMVGFDGNLYDWGGDDDAGDKINWQWRTGITDLNTRGLKGVLGYYIDGIIESKIMVDLVLDTGVFVYRHDPRGVPNDYKTHRISTGRGLRSSNVGIGAAGSCYIAIDSVTPDYVVSNRNL